MPSQTVRTGRVNALQGALALKAPVRYTTTGPIELRGLNLQLYGEWTTELEVGDRVLVKNQENPVENGVYSADTSNWKRTPDFDGGEDAVVGTLVSVLDGDQGKGFWAVSSPGIPVGRALYIGIHPLTFSRVVVGTTAPPKGVIDVVDELPTSGMLTGDVVYLTLDAKLYRYDGYNWVTWVDGADILAASITAGKLAVIDLSAITTSTGTLTVGAGGYIRGGQTDYNTGTGFFLGYSGGNYVFSLGDPNGDKITWDGSNLHVSGGLTVSYEDVTGPKPPSDATKNIIYRQNSAPTGGTYTTGDLWVDTDSNPLTLYQWTGSAWAVISNNVGLTSQLINDSGWDGTQAALQTGTTITGGGITLSGGGSIKGGQTDYNTGTGFFLGHSGGTYKFSIGSPTGNRMTWDGTNLTIVGGGTFSGALSAATGTFTGTLSAVTGSFGDITAGGSITLSNTGNIKGGQTAYNTGTGFWLGYSGGTYKLSIGNPSGNRLTWDGSTLQFSGTLNGANGIFSGQLNAATGTFAGTLTASNVIVTGNLQADAVTKVNGQYAENLVLFADEATIVSAQSAASSSGNPTIIIDFALMPQPNYSHTVKLYRDSTVIATFNWTSGYPATPFAFTVSDYPGDTNAHTYSLVNSTGLPRYFSNRSIVVSTHKR